jgi:hypothetical protein
MLNMLKSKAVTLFVSAIALSSGTTLASFLATASYNDALDHYSWIDASQLNSALPGQFYVISDQNEIREPLCSLAPGEFAPQEHPEPGVRLVNVLGEALPFVSRILGVVAPSLQAKEASTSVPYIFELNAFRRSSVPVDSLLDHDRQILEDRDMEALSKNLDDKHFAEVKRLESCANAIATRLRQGFRVCQLTEVTTDQATDRPLGVTFASACLARQEDTEPRYLPDLRHYPLWTRVKRTLGLIEARFLPDSATPPA